MRVAKSIEELHHTPEVEIVCSIEKGRYFLVVSEAEDVAESCLIIHCGIISRHEQATHEKGKTSASQSPLFKLIWKLINLTSLATPSGSLCLVRKG